MRLLALALMLGALLALTACGATPEQIAEAARATEVAGNVSGSPNVILDQGEVVHVSLDGNNDEQFKIRFISFERAVDHYRFNVEINDVPQDSIGDGGVIKLYFTSEDKYVSLTGEWMNAGSQLLVTAPGRPDVVFSQEDS